MEIEKEVKTYHVEMQCDTCKAGLMKQEPFQQAIELWKTTGYEKPLFPHVCGNSECGAKATYPVQYPTLRYKFVV